MSEGVNPTARRRQRRARQLERLQAESAERMAQRNRARRDRDALAQWIEETLPGARVDRSHSGKWRVLPR